jgi:transposase
MTFIRKIKRNGRIYLAEVENYREGAKVKQRHLRYIGEDPQSEKDHQLFQPVDLNVATVKVYGPVIVLESLARELGMFEILGDIAHPILALTFAHCMSYKSIADTEDWFSKTDLASIFECSEISQKQLYNAIDQLSKYDFEHLEKSIFEKISTIFGGDESGVIYDGTNTYLSGSRSNIAKMGKCKEGVRGRKLIQIGLGVTRSLGLPIFHQVHAGNIHDTKMFNEAILRFSDLGVKSGLAVFDRGITSENCINKLNQEGWKCLAGLQMHKGVKSAISNLDFDNMKKFKNMVIQGDTKFFVTSIPFQIGATKGKLIVLQNYLKKQRQAIERMAMIEQAKGIEAIKISNEIKKFFTADGKINHHAVQSCERLDGLSFLFTNANLSLKDSVN